MQVKAESYSRKCMKQQQKYASFKTDKEEGSK